MEPALAAWRLARITALSLIVIEGVAQAGKAARRFIARGEPDALERFGTEYLVGLSVVGTALLGLAAAALFRPAALIGVFLGMAAVGIRSAPGSVLARAVRDAVRRIGEHRPGAAMRAAGSAALLLGMATSVLWVLVPEIEIDSYVCHLAVPDQLLKSGRILIDQVPLAFRISLPTEMVYSLALIAGDDRIAKCLSLASFCAASAVFASAALKTASTVSFWAGPLLAISSASLLWLAPITKHDATAVAMIVAGYLLMRRRSHAVGALLLGAGLAAKVVYGPFAVLFFLMARPPVRMILPGLVLMILPAAPWMAKEVFASGNPVYPFAAGIIPTFGWGARNWAAFGMRQNAMGMAGITGVRDLATAWWSCWRMENILLLACLPGLLAFGRRKWEVWAVVAGQVVMLWLTRQPRYLLPATWLIALLAAEEAERRAGPAGAGIAGGSGRREAAVAATAAVWMILATMIGTGVTWERRSRWNLVLSEAETTYRNTLSTYAGLTDDLRRIGATRPLIVGDFRTYRMPARAVYAGGVGEMPLIWRIAAESRDMRDMRRKFKQTGADIMVVNFISVFYIAQYYADFHWSREMLANYQEFSRSFLDPVGTASRSDMASGCFGLISVHDRPIAPPQETVFFLPGAETAFLRELEMEKRAMPTAQRTELEAVSGIIPRVRFARSELARICLTLNDNRKAYEVLKPLIAAGAREESILAVFGTAAYGLNRLDGAERAFRLHIDLYRYNTDVIRYRLAHVLYLRTVRSDGRTPSPTDAVLLREAEKLQDCAPESPNAVSPAVRQEARAYIKGRLADYLAGHGDAAGARRLYEQALELGPNLPMAVIWRGKLNRI